MSKLSAELNTCGCEAQIACIALDPNAVSLVETYTTH